jgi:hypothetical protein
MDEEIRRTRRHRRWADVVVIFTGVYSLLFAIYAPQLAVPGARAMFPVAPGLWWVLYVIAGPMALLALLVAFRSVTAARLMVAVAGALLLSGVALFPGIGTTVTITLIVPGALLLLASPFVGPMPTPEEEGRRR